MKLIPGDSTNNVEMLMLFRETRNRALADKQRSDEPDLLATTPAKAKN